MEKIETYYAVGPNREDEQERLKRREHARAVLQQAVAAYIEESESKSGFGEDLPNEDLFTDFSDFLSRQ